MARRLCCRGRRRGRGAARLRSARRGARRGRRPRTPRCGYGRLRARAGGGAGRAPFGGGVRREESAGEGLVRGEGRGPRRSVLRRCAGGWPWRFCAPRRSAGGQGCDRGRAHARAKRRSGGQRRAAGKGGGALLGAGGAAERDRDPEQVIEHDPERVDHHVDHLPRLFAGRHLRRGPRERTDRTAAHERRSAPHARTALPHPRESPRAFTMSAVVRRFTSG